MTPKSFNSGADKIAINTGALKSPDLLNDLIKRFGSQAIVLSIEVKKKDNDFWEVYTESGRQETGVNVLDWVKKCDKIGVGEFLITSIDNEGTGRGFDVNLAKQVRGITNIPILSGGFGKVKDIIDVFESVTRTLWLLQMLYIMIKRPSKKLEKNV